MSFAQADVNSLIQFIRERRSGINYSELLTYLTTGKKGKKFNLFDARNMILEAHKNPEIGSYRFTIDGAGTMFANKEVIEAMKSEDIKDQHPEMLEFSLNEHPVGISEILVAQSVLSFINGTHSKKASRAEICDFLLEEGWIELADISGKRGASAKVNRVLGRMQKAKDIFRHSDNIFYLYPEMENFEVNNEDDEDLIEIEELAEEGFDVDILFSIQGIKSLVVVSDNKLFPTQELVIGSGMVLSGSMLYGIEPYATFNNVVSISLVGVDGEVKDKRNYNGNVYVYLK